MDVLKHTPAAQNIYPLDNFTFGTKPSIGDKDRNGMDQITRRKQQYEEVGMRRSVYGVLVSHEHNHPHVLLLKVGTTFHLPGGRLKPGEDEIEGLKRKLSMKLAPQVEELTPDWEVGELVAQWSRPNHEDLIEYPYVPPHITSPKESVKLFIIRLPEKCIFAIPNNMKLLAVPLFEIYKRDDKYGNLIANLPVQLSRYDFNCL